MRKIPVTETLVAAALAIGICAAPMASAKSVKTATTTPFPGAATASVRTINPERIKADVKFLSDDLLEGRAPGQRGGTLAAKYIAAQFAVAGLKPAGDNGSYLQKVPMVGLTTQPGSTFAIVPANGGRARELKFAKEITAYNETATPEVDVNADVVFVGYGIEAPEYNWNDYKDVDVKGKILLMLVNEPTSDDPKFFQGKALTYYGRWTYKLEEAARKGAVGALLVHKTDMASYGWNVVETSNTGERDYLRDSGKPKLQLASWIQLGVGDEMAKTIGKDVDTLIKMAQSRDFRPMPLPLKMKAHVVSKVRPFDCNNVLAMLPGSDAKLKDQAVLYSAHWDHLGMHPDQPGDNIYNGAIDNATGVAVLLDIARSFATNPVKPKRSVYFAAVTAEEQGLLGSEWLGVHPPVPARNISLVLNYDGLAPLGVPEEVSLTGAERNTFYPTVEQTAKEFKLSIVPDDNPGAGHYYRSDHFSLSRVGIPAFSVSQGSKFEGKTKEYAETFQKEYTKNNYHQPSDEYREDWNFAGIAKMARFGVSLGWKAANAPQLVQWHPGDEFEAARKSSQGK